MKDAISVIIPVFHEAHIINRLLMHLDNQGVFLNGEVIVADGASERDTLAAITDDRAVLHASAKGRGIQMNAGASLSNGDILLFLHADTYLPPGGLRQIRQVCRDEKVAAGAFDLSIDSPKAVFRIIEKAASLRSRITRTPYGDQAIFCRRLFFQKIGGFRELTIMEDVELMSRIRQTGGKIRLIKSKVRTSARRWENEGIICGTLRNWLILSLFYAGFSSERLARFYRYPEA